MNVIHLDLSRAMALAKPFRATIGLRALLGVASVSAVLTAFVAPIFLRGLFPNFAALEKLASLELALLEEPLFIVAAVLSLGYLRPIIVHSFGRRAAEKLLVGLAKENTDATSPYRASAFSFRTQFRIVESLIALARSLASMLTLALFGFFFGARAGSAASLIFCVLLIVSFGPAVTVLRRATSRPTDLIAPSLVLPRKIHSDLSKSLKRLKRPAMILKNTWFIELVAYSTTLFLLGAWFGDVNQAKEGPFGIVMILVLGLSLRNAQLGKANYTRLSKLLALPSEVEDDEESANGD